MLHSMIIFAVLLVTIGTISTKGKSKWKIIYTLLRDKPIKHFQSTICLDFGSTIVDIIIQYNRGTIIYVLCFENVSIWEDCVDWHLDPFYSKIPSIRLIRCNHRCCTSTLTLALNQNINLYVSSSPDLDLIGLLS